jgi:hypothetical protein
MGLNATAVTDITLTECENTFSTNFCYFLCGLDAHINPEFGQLEKVLDCDLSVLKQMDLYHFSENEEQAWLQTEAESPADEEKIKQRFREGRAEAFQEISRVKASLQTLLLRLKSSVRYYDQLAYNEEWLYDYFKGGNFENDIEEVLAFAICAEKEGASRITFAMG